MYHAQYDKKILYIIINKYKHRSRIKQLRQKKFKTFKEVISLNAFKEHFTKDFYSTKELIKLKKFFNMDNRTLDAFNEITSLNVLNFFCLNCLILLLCLYLF